MTEWRLAAYRHWLTMTPPHWAKLAIAPIDFQAISYYAAPKKKPKSLDEVDPKLLATYDKLGVPLHERARLAGVAVDAVFDSVSVGTTFKNELAKAGVIFCSFSEAVQRAPGTGAPVPRHRGADRRQLLRGAELGGVLRRQLRVRAQGRALPDGAQHLFPHQRRDTGQFERTLIIARTAATSATSKAAPRRCATRTSCTPRWSNWSRWTTPDQVFDRAELVSGRRERRRRHLQLRDQARRMPRRAQQDLLDPGRNRLGHHLEIPELRAARRGLGGRVLFGGADHHRQQADTGTKMIHLGAQHQARSSARASAPARARTPIAAW
jgi:Fe-S cluster assembly protein SufB